MRELDQLWDYAQALAKELRDLGIEVKDDATRPNRLDLLAEGQPFVVAFSPSTFGFSVFCTSADGRVTVFDKGRCDRGEGGLNRFPCNAGAELRRTGSLDQYMKATAATIADALLNCGIFMASGKMGLGEPCCFCLRQLTCLAEVGSPNSRCDKS